MRRLAPLVAIGLGLTGACTPDPETSTAEANPLVDADGDGWPLPEDCADADPAVHPGADERCDQVDEDCDGARDDHPSDGIRAWLDLDRDGWGDPSTADFWCGDPEADPRPWVENALDCDDADALVYPGATERCDAPGDDDCDGADNELDALGCTLWYEDTDGDGVGVERSACLCAADGRWSATSAGDCDDADPATIGCTNGGPRDLADSDSVILGAAANDGAGTDISGAGDLDGDGWIDLLVGASSPVARPAWWLVRGPFTRDTDLAAASAVFEQSAVGTATSLTTAGGVDLTGDGAEDLILAAYGQSDTNRSLWTGRAYVVSGPLAGAVDLTYAQASFEAVETATPFDLRVAALPDADGDGIGDLLVGGRWTDAAWLFPGPVSGRLESFTAPLTLTGQAVDLGSSVASAGDVDGDGLTDLLVGTPNSGESRAGGAWLVAGGALGTLTEDAATAVLVGGAPNESAGKAVAGAGDVNADGYADVAVGGPSTVDELARAGSVWIVLGPLAGDVPLAGAEARLDGVAAGDLAFSVTGAGDVDADGFDDVLVGSPKSSTGAVEGGAAAVYYGPIIGSLRTVDAGLRLYGGGSADAAGVGLAGPGDLDLDGFDDLVVGVPGLDLGGEDAGGAYVVRGEAR